MMPRIFRTTSFYFTTASAAILCVSMAVVATFFYLSVERSWRESLTAQIEGEIQELLVDYRDDGLNELQHDIRERIELNHPERLRYFLQSPSGKVVFDRIQSIPQPYGWHEVRLPSTKKRGDKSIYVLLQSIPLEDGYSMAVAADLSAIKELQQGLLRSIGWLIGITLLLGLSGGLLLSKRFLARLDEIIKATQRIGSDNLSERITNRGTGDDFDQLAVTINQMLERIEHLVGSVKNVTTHIAHDLRTPLGHLRQYLEKLSLEQTNADQDQQLEAALAKVDEILEIFSALLRIVELESGNKATSFSNVDLSALLQRLVETYQAVAEEQQQNLSAEISPNLKLEADQQLLTQLFANLIENAINHTTKAGNIIIEATTINSEIIVTVADNGPGIDPQYYADVFRPFFRLANKPHSKGLGLSIVGAIAKLHGIAVELHDNKPGLLVVLRCKR